MADRLERGKIVQTISNDDPRWREVSRIRAEDGSILISWQLTDEDGLIYNRLQTIRPKRRISEQVGVWNYFDEE